MFNFLPFLRFTWFAFRRRNNPYCLLCWEPQSRDSCHNQFHNFFQFSRKSKKPNRLILFLWYLATSFINRCERRLKGTFERGYALMASIAASESQPRFIVGSSNFGESPTRQSDLSLVKRPGALWRLMVNFFKALFVHKVKNVGDFFPDLQILSSSFS